MAQTLPTARKDGLIVRELKDETLVYDQVSHEAHSLNRTAVIVWKHCDGQTTVKGLARALQDELGLASPSNEDLVRLALQQLDECHLLQAGNVPAGAISRRELLKLGFAAAVLPLVNSIVAPSADQAQSPTPTEPDRIDQPEPDGDLGDAGLP